MTPTTDDIKYVHSLIAGHHTGRRLPMTAEDGVRLVDLLGRLFDNEEPAQNSPVKASGNPEDTTDVDTQSRREASEPELIPAVLASLELRIPMRAKAWQRAGHRKGGGKFNPNESYQAGIRAYFMAQNGGRRRTWRKATGPVRVEIDCHFANKVRRGPMHGKRTDSDNLAKNLLDALNGLLYDDDGRVCDLHVRKFWSEEDLIVIRAFEVAVGTTITKKGNKNA